MLSNVTDTSTVGAYEAKTHLAQLLDRVASGESITITRNGKVVAVLCPPQVETPLASVDAMEQILAWRDQQGPTLGGDLTIRDLIEEGRRH